MEGGEDRGGGEGVGGLLGWGVDIVVVSVVIGWEELLRSVLLLLARAGGGVGLGQVFPKGRPDVQRLCEIGHGIGIAEESRVESVDKVRMGLGRAVGEVGDGEKGECSCSKDDGNEESFAEVAESDVGES